VQVLVDFGFKRATVELVAKYAGVSRATVRWQSRDALIQAAVLREFTTVFDTAVRDLDDRGTFDDKVVRAFTAVVWSLRNHPLMTREPQAVLPFLTTAPAMQTALSVVAARLRRSAQANDLNLTDPEALADILVRLAHSVLLVPHPDRPLTTRIDIEDYAQRHVRPVTRYASRRPFAPPARPARKTHRSAAGLLAAAAVTALVGTAAATSWATYSGWPAVSPLESVKSTQPPAAVAPSVTSVPPSTRVFTAPPPSVTTTPAKPAPHTVSAPTVSRAPSSTLVTVAAPPAPLPDSDPRRATVNSSGGTAHPGSPPGPGSHLAKPGEVPKVTSAAKARSSHGK
jgi:AcrR family transcriptional regulator